MAPPSPLSKHQTQPPLRQLAAEKLHGKGSNPSQLGDPISLKAETSNSWPTGGNPSARGGSTAFSLSDAAKRTMLGDPVSLKAETVDTEPADHDNGPSGSGGSAQKSKL
ncbi:uncharacterized protein BKCO1_1200024 [Diplodia corticola]|uniref:Uncharacterized protein n=1 Tax=Diplodia corticola TaxID=236234 RepID=A0A1J9R7N3_9PEZI|nr:uncharacterized protein BKCO1_1200024 [Diplodia corticola]OJD36210.1 hypothetical protein BKCO1_1200024 [Diplodia corticola]